MTKVVFVAALVLAWCAAPAQAQSVNLLTNASFEQPSFRGWAAYPDTPLESGTVTSGGAREGAGYGGVQTRQAGSSFFQDVSTTVLARRSYTLSLWVRSASGAPYKGTLALFGILDTETEGAGTNFTAGPEWTLVTVALNTTRSHSALRAQMYLHTENARLFVDGAQLFDTGIVNSSWELGSFDGWVPEVDQATVTTLPDARDGTQVGVVGTAVAGRSFYQDFGVGQTVGQSYTFSIWMRSVSGTPVSGTLALWGLGGEYEPSSTRYIVGGAWTLVSATLSPTRGDHTGLRSQVYIETAGVSMYVDGAQLTTNGLANASFDQGFFRNWDRFPRGSLIATTETTAGVPREGSGYGAVRTEVPGRSFAQEVAVPTAAGASRTFSAWLRSPTGASGSVVLTGTGGTDESTATPFYVGPRWTYVSAPLDATQAHSGLRAEVVLDTPGAELDVDAASLSSGNARDDALLSGPAAGAPPPPAPDADADGVADATDLCRTLAGGLARRGCPLGLTNRTSIAYRRSGKGIHVVRYYVEATKGARVVVSCSKGCRKTFTKGRGAKRVRITRLSGRRLKSGAKITVTVSAPGRLTAKVVDSVKKGRRVAGRRHCYVPGTSKPSITC